MVKYNYSIKEDFLHFSFEQKKIILISLFCVATVLSDILAVKIINWGSITLECGCILFPTCYLISDVICEVYNEQTMVKTAFLGMGMKVFMVIVTTLAVLAPYNPAVFTGQSALASVFNFVPRIVIASIAGYLVGSVINSRTMSICGNLTNGRFLALRTILSTVFGELADTILFIGIAFAFTMSFESLLMFILSQYILKVGIEVVLQPLTFKLVAWARGDEEMLDYKREDLSF